MNQVETRLAMDNGTPVRNTPLPYGHQQIDEDDIRMVTDVLRSDWLTTGPKVAEFEEAFSQITGARQAVAVSNGTAALHTAMHAAGIGPGDQVIVPAMTFAATANCVVFQGGTPVFADVSPHTLLIDPDQVVHKITPRTRAIIAVDYAGQPCDYEALRTIAGRHGLVLVADACHSLGATYRGRPVGTLADLNTFSFHPVKHITTGEGGMVTTGDPVMAERMRRFRNHGIGSDQNKRNEQGTWYYEMTALGYNYRMTDFQCALGISQLRKLGAWVAARQEIARHYHHALADIEGVAPLGEHGDVTHAYHLYVVRLDSSRFKAGREVMFKALRAEGIGVNVHYIPVHLHPFYRSRFGTTRGMCPAAEEAYEEILSLPIFPGMSMQDREDVIRALRKVVSGLRR